MFDGSNPLWLPAGSVRAMLAISLITSYAYVCVMSKNYEALGLIAIIIAKDYFDSRKA